MTVFANISNHSSKTWSEEQIQAAKAMGENVEIIDIPFPSVSSTSTPEEIRRMAGELVFNLPKNTAFAMVQGEFTLTFDILVGLQANGIRCFAACSDRQTIEQVQADGSVKKISTFNFVQFREYNKK